MGNVVYQSTACDDLQWPWQVISSATNIVQYVAFIHHEVIVG